MRVPLLVHLFAGLVLACAGSALAADAGAFAEPRPGLHAGGQPDSAQLRAFAASGGEVVIDLRGVDEERGYDEAALARELGLRYMQLPIAGGADLTGANAAALARALADAPGPVLLHCASGNRVGALLALAAANEEGLAPMAALELGRRAGLGSLEPLVRERLGLEPR